MRLITELEHDGDLQRPIRSSRISLDCRTTKVEISVIDRNEIYFFCPKRYGFYERPNWDILILNDDLRVEHKILEVDSAKTSRFSIRYHFENLPCSPKIFPLRRWGGFIPKTHNANGTKNIVPMARMKRNARQFRSGPCKRKWRSQTLGWQENTHRGITALFLASDRNIKKANLEGNLMVKQLEVQTLVYLLRKETDSVTANQLSMFINALIVTCQDPSNFYGHDLVKLLKEVPVSSAFTHPVAYLALCNAGATLPALLSADQQKNQDWNYNKTVNHLIHYLNSSSVDLQSVYLIIPILNGKSLSHIKNTDCSTKTQRDSVSDIKSKLGSKMRVQYSLNIGDEKDIIHTISLRVPQNITIFEVMQLAQDADSKYKFRAKKMKEKLYIYDIARITNDVEDGKFWLLYVGNDAESVRLTNEKYTIKTMECLNKNSFKCDNNTCVSEERVCDGVKDCKNGADEIGCETGVLSIKGVPEAREKAISWMKQKRTPAWGWKSNTPRAVVALYLASGASFNGTVLEEELMAKQTELKTAVALLRPSLTNSELNMLINALLVTCHSPRHFYGNNLVKRLKEHGGIRELHAPSGLLNALQCQRILASQSYFGS
ncbi:hypothetical protein HNY73_021656 [Argiope bruennichi]|uniref:Uncharacterized protein n=1 Tax=Argiope bruennichi TaxID=94029 RepID=A0A8T0DYA1_ARGBR|nr:hypothetical protein HNY73_021656 [Argiope bruennichi]